MCIRIKHHDKDDFNMPIVIMVLHGGWKDTLSHFADGLPAQLLDGF